MAQKNYNTHVMQIPFLDKETYEMLKRLQKSPEGTFSQYSVFVMAVRFLYESLVDETTKEAAKVKVQEIRDKAGLRPKKLLDKPFD